MDYTPGTLWQAIKRRSEHALQTGALVSIPTDATYLEDGSVRFFVRVMASLRRKDEERKQREASHGPVKKTNPFLPPEQDLFVTHLTETHSAILNKFNVVDHHLLIITRGYQDQRNLLTLRDLEALWLCMAEYEGLGFYNGGPEGGASQPHKHLQIVPLPIAPEGPRIPIQPLIDRAVVDERGFGALPEFDFMHVFVRYTLNSRLSYQQRARETFATYSAMLASLGMETPDPAGAADQSGPYCLIITPEWMLLVPRLREHFEDISLNALAFVGSLFVRDEAQLSRLRSVGPRHALKSVAFAPGVR